MRLGLLSSVVALVLVSAGAVQAVEPAAPVVVVDPGHDLRANPVTEPIGPGSATRKIKDGGGTRGVVTGVSEADVVLAVSLRLRALLTRAGVRVVMTRTATSGTSIGNVARARIANRAHAGLFLRVHADGSLDRQAHGGHTLVPAFRRGWTDDIHEASARAGRIVQREVQRSLGLADRGVRERSDFTGFNWSNVPVVLVELGFLTNPSDERVLTADDGQRRAAVGLCRGALRFLGRPAAACG